MAPSKLRQPVDRTSTVLKVLIGVLIVTLACGSFYIWEFVSHLSYGQDSDAKQ